MKTVLLFLGMSIPLVAVAVGIMVVDNVQKTRFELVQCQIQSLKYRNEVCDLKKERAYVKKKIGAFYPKIEWKEK